MRLISAILLLLQSTSSESRSPMRNPKLRDLPDNTWVKVGPFKGREKGACEVPWCYDSDRKVFVRVGGCTNAYSNEVWSYDLGTETWTQNVKFGAPTSNFPGHGCNRGIAYDPDHNCIWTLGGASSYSPPGNYLGLWKGVADLGEGKWTRMKGVPYYEQARVAYDRGARKVILIWRNMGCWHQTIVFDPLTEKWTFGAASPYEEQKEGRLGLGEWVGFEYVPELKGCVLFAAPPDKVRKENPKLSMITWLFDASTGKWRDLAPAGPVPSRRTDMGLSYDSKNHVVAMYGGRDEPGFDDTWIYDPKKSAWIEMKPKTTPGGGTECQMMAYDPEHNVHVLVQQMGRHGDAVWAYRYKR